MISSRRFLLVVLGAFALQQSLVPVAAVTAAEHEGPAEEAREPETDEPRAVIPPGQEDLLAEMLGRGAPLASGCTFAGGHADGPSVRVTYTCPSGEVVLELAHPDQARSTTAKTERFAITLQSGSPPDELVADLVSRIRSRENLFEWKWIGRRRGASRLRTIVLGVAAVGLLGLAALAWALRRRASDRGTPSR
jgi:hypothetical protein